ncbi:cytochrome c-type biogenesis protein CcmH, partial [Mycobacterium tuberculosis]|nr:cytochrome c-type biogenesis protein CcmH [Mycobacterium tuberculosis]
GQYVLLKPQFNAVTAALWLGPFLLLAGGGVYLWRRRSRRSDELFRLTEEEEARLERLLKDVDQARNDRIA